MGTIRHHSCSTCTDSFVGVQMGVHKQNNFTLPLVLLHWGNSVGCLDGARQTGKRTSYTTETTWGEENIECTTIKGHEQHTQKREPLIPDQTVYDSARHVHFCLRSTQHRVASQLNSRLCVYFTWCQSSCCSSCGFLFQPVGAFHGLHCVRQGN